MLGPAKCLRAQITGRELSVRLPTVTGFARKSLISPCSLSVLCVSVVVFSNSSLTTAVQRTQRLHREEGRQRLFGQTRLGPICEILRRDLGGIPLGTRVSAARQYNLTSVSRVGVRGLRIAVERQVEFEILFHFGTAGEGLDMTLDSIPKEVSARVIAVDASGSGGLRLMDMGIVPGAPVRVINRAPLGDPIRIFVRNYHMALRCEEARSVHVTLCDD